MEVTEYRDIEWPDGINLQIQSIRNNIIYSLQLSCTVLHVCSCTKKKHIFSITCVPVTDSLLMLLV